MLEALLGAEGKRKMRLRRKTNTELFTLYADQLALKHRSPDARDEAKRVLNHFSEFLGQYPPTPELATSFLATFVDKKPTTLYRYHSIVKMFMAWYGEPLLTNIKLPETLPQYVESDDIIKLENAMRSKKSHKKVIDRNLLIIKLGIRAGLRREEISNLKVQDVDFNRNCLTVRAGKGNVDRVVELTISLNEMLSKYLAGRSPGEYAFNLSPSTISGIIHWAALRAGINVHTHSLRHYFAQNLIDNGTDVETVRRLMGHKNLKTTQVYLARTDQQRSDAIKKLESKSMVEPGGNQEDGTNPNRTTVVETDRNIEHTLNEKDVKIPIPEPRFEGRYAEEWEHYRKIHEAMINLQYVPVEQRAMLLDEIQRERVTLKDTKLQNKLDLFINAIQECTKLGMSVSLDEVLPTTTYLNLRMNKSYKR